MRKWNETCEISWSLEWEEIVLKGMRLRQDNAGNSSVNMHLQLIDLVNGVKQQCKLWHLKVTPLGKELEICFTYSLLYGQEPLIKEIKTLQTKTSVIERAFERILAIFMQVLENYGKK
jgi:hypothetical protein